jgi:hypothetical protein
MVLVVRARRAQEARSTSVRRGFTGFAIAGSEAISHTRLRECCDILGCGAGTLAHHADVNLMTARRWLNGKVPIPPDVARVVEQMAALAETLAHKPG